MTTSPTDDLFREDATLRECTATLLRADERGLLLPEQRTGDAHVERVGGLVGVGQARSEAERAIVVPLHLERAVDARELGLLVARLEDVHPGTDAQATPFLGVPTELKPATVQAVWLDGSGS